MTYSYDLREKAIKYIEEGGSKSEAVRIFGVSRGTLYRWIGMEDVRPKRRRKGYTRKLDKKALQAHVDAYPDMLLRERAAHFGVRINSIWVALKVLDMTKKNDEV